MKKSPIPYSNDMVRSLLRREKTMTRRVINTQKNGWNCHSMKFGRVMNLTEQNLSERYKKISKSLNGFHAFFFEPGASAELGIKCPYGQPGDVLWVREAYMPITDRPEGVTQPVWYRADQDENNPIKGWKSGRFMPMDAARIWLRIKSIGVERLQDITEIDALKEGVECNKGGMFRDYYNTTKIQYPYNTARASFISLINQLHGTTTWRTNPWVWVIEFEVLSVKGMPEELKEGKNDGEME